MKEAEQLFYSYFQSKGEDSNIDKFVKCVEQCDDIKSNTIIKVNIFVEVENNIEYALFNEEVALWLETYEPTWLSRMTLIAQPPSDNAKVMVEVIRHVEPYETCTTLAVGGHNYDVLSYKNCDLIIGASCSGLLDAPVEQQSQEAFRVVQDILEAENLTFADIIRQWNYIQNIIGFEDGKQNYQVFNNVRAAYYEKSEFAQGYPAATGIGQSFGGVIVDFFAIRYKGCGVVLPIKNPLQTDAHQYSSKVLLGHEQLKQPKFERAKLLLSGRKATVFISGTAAIKGEDSVSSDGIEQQLDVTLENINMLVNQDYLSKISGFILRKKEHKFSGLRVYVRKMEDIPTVKLICNQRFPDTPIGIVQADICRDNLFLEIEGACCLNVID